TDDAPPGNLFQVDPAVGAALAEKVARYRAARGRDAAQRALDALETTARGRENLVPRIVDAVEAAVTLGEICDRLRGVFGVHEPSVTFLAGRPRRAPPRSPSSWPPPGSRTRG